MIKLKLIKVILLVMVSMLILGTYTKSDAIPIMTYTYREITPTAFLIPAPTYTPTLSIIPTLSITPTNIPIQLSNITGAFKFAFVPPPQNAFQISVCEVLFDEDGKMWLCSFDYINAPKADLNMDGSFVLNNLEPNTYGLVMSFSPYFNIMPHYPGTNYPIIFTIPPDYDIGILAYSDSWCSLWKDASCYYYFPFIAK